MKKQIFVCFIGLDGSGKSTLIDSIRSFLKSKNYHSVVRWGAYDQWILRPIIWITKTLLLKESEPYNDYKKYQEDIAGFSKSSWKARLFKKLVLLEYKIEIILKVWIPLKLGKNIILDRYIYDTATNLSVNLGLGSEEHYRLIKDLLKKNPNPHLVFFVDIPEEESMKRKDDIPSIEYLRKRRAFYKEIQDKFDNFIVLNGLKTKSDLADEAIKTLSSYYSI